MCTCGRWKTKGRLHPDADRQLLADAAAPAFCRRERRQSLLECVSFFLFPIFFLFPAFSSSTSVDCQADIDTDTYLSAANAREAAAEAATLLTETDVVGEKVAVVE